MITPYLKAIDRDMYNRCADFNLGYLSNLKLMFSAPGFDDKAYVNNILAKDEFDDHKIQVDQLPKKLHSALISAIDELYFYNEKERSVINGILTYVEMSIRPDLDNIVSRLAPLQEIHKGLIEVSLGADAITIFAKLLYNRSRMLALQSRGLNRTERELVTNFDKVTDVQGVAEYLCRVNNAHNAIRSLRHAVVPNLRDRDICEMIENLASAMMSYRSSLIAPDRAGLADVNMDASEDLLMKREPTTAAGENLKNVIDRYNKLELPYTPADFLLSLNEGIRLSGVYLMV